MWGHVLEFVGWIETVIFVSLKEENVLAGFKKCGISPVCRNAVLNMLLSTTGNSDFTQSTNDIDKATKALDYGSLELFKMIRHDEMPKKRKRNKLNTTPGNKDD